jgi:hypothetical protein
MGMYFILERSYKSPAGIMLTADVAELTAYNFHDIGTIKLNRTHGTEFNIEFTDLTYQKRI